MCTESKGLNPRREHRLITLEAIARLPLVGEPLHQVGKPPISGSWRGLADQGRDGIMSCVEQSLSR